MNRILVGLIIFAVTSGGAAPFACADTHYVNKANGSPQTPFTNGWASAATSIQDAVGAATAGDLVLVTNGIYDTGGTLVGGLTNRVYINKAITVSAVSTHPADTVIVGAPHPITTNGTAASRDSVSGGQVHVP